MKWIEFELARLASTIGTELDIDYLVVTVRKRLSPKLKL